MSRPEPVSHTFLIRIWIEETFDEAGRVAWRGHITHLPDEQRRYLGSLEDVAGFIREAVAGMDEPRSQSDQGTDAEG